MTQFIWKNFSDLTNDELYDLLALRSDIFVVEQHCAYLDPDDKDKYALHLLGKDNQKLVAYLRLFLPNDIENYLVFGRVVTSREARGQGQGKAMMSELVNYCEKHYPDIQIKCSAQNYLRNFYESFGFKTYTDVYDEDGIPHVGMKRGV